jgi:hypothetical protein
MIPQYATINVSTSTFGPGSYIVTKPNITITLETWLNWPDRSASIVVKDQTGSNSPNITIIASNGGTIDNGASIVIANKNESLRFVPSTNGNNYVVN